MKFVSVDKMSKKNRAAFYNIQRNTWGVLKPYSRKHKSGKTFKRIKGATTYDLAV